MGIDLAEWLNLALRWLHLITGIAWIGSSFYFVWLDNHLTPPKSGDASGELWSVHGGGFYHNQKYMLAPAQMPDQLHWFKWEAYFTWISGFSLLVLIYYVGASSFLIDPSKAKLGQGEAIGIGLAALAAGWLVYDGLCRFDPLARDNRLLGVVWFLVLTGAAYVLDQVFQSRAAYLHVGAMIGSVMVGNVFFVIIPNQRKVVAAMVAGREPDPALGKAAKQRSLHNNYMTLPVLFIMLSHHYPMTYGAERPWLVLALICATGVAVRHVFNLRHRAVPTGRVMMAAAALAYVSVAYVAYEQTSRAPTSAGEPTRWAQIEPLMARHCVTCHAAKPANTAFPIAPMGVILETREQVAALSPRIRKVAVDTEVMPLGNATNMTAAERAQLGAWLAAGAPE